MQVYHTYFTPLEYTVAKRGDNTCYAKLICNKQDNVSKHADTMHVTCDLHACNMSFKCRLHAWATLFNHTSIIMPVHLHTQLNIKLMSVIIIAYTRLICAVNQVIIL